MIIPYYIKIFEMDVWPIIGLFLILLSSDVKLGLLG